MKRTNIFELYNQNNTVERDILRVSQLLDSKNGIVEIVDPSKGTSIKAIVNAGFRFWKNSGHAIDLNDYLDTVDYAGLSLSALDSKDDYLSYIEIIYNIWHIADNIISRNIRGAKWGSDGLFLKELLDTILKELNQIAYYDPETEQCLIGEDSPQVTAAVEVTEPETASQILHYNHKQLAGNLAEKKAILFSLAKYLEGRETELKSVNGQLFTDLNSVFNNLDIRHDNATPRESFEYKEKLATMSPEELEKWYDDIYQLILLAILEMDNVERRKKLRLLVQDINQ